MSNGATISMGVGARRLRDRDYLSTSDPYLLVSKPSASGGYTQLRKSETRKNCLNPDWSDFLFNEQELNQHDWDLQLKLEVFDNDFGSSRDDFMGVAYVSLRQLEAAALVKSSLALSDGKGKVRAGSLVVRSFSRHQAQGAGYPGGHGTGIQRDQGAGFNGHGAGFPGYVGHTTPLPYQAQPAQGVQGVFYPAQGAHGYPHPNSNPGFPHAYQASVSVPYQAPLPAQYQAHTPAPVSGATISLGVGARKLRDRDYLSTSDPYILVSKPSASGGYTQLRKSETRKNCLNPDWSDFLFNEQELNQHDLDLQLKLEVFDNDFGSSRDDFMGVAYVSLRQLEAAALVKSSLALSDGKGKVRAGSLVVRSFSRHQAPSAGYPGGHGAGFQSNAPSPYTPSAQASYPSVAPSGHYARAPYPASAPAPYPAYTPTPYPASAPAPYPVSHPPPYPASASSPYPAFAPAPYPASAPALYPSQGPEVHNPPAPYPPASATPSLPPAYPQPGTYNRPGPGGFIARPY